MRTYLSKVYRKIFGLFKKNQNQQQENADPKIVVGHTSTNSNLNSRYGAVFIALFALIGSYLLIHSFASSLITPVKLQPLNGSTTSSLPIMMWKNVAYATSYRMEISKSFDTKYNSPIVDKMVTSSSYTFSTPLTAGNYIWRLRAKNSSSHSSWTTSTNFAVSYVKGIIVSGNRLLRDGVSFRPKGFTLVSALPPGGNTKLTTETQTEMSAAKTWNADTLRFQVSQWGLDPTSSCRCELSYLQQVKLAVTLARNNGFNVIISLQDQGYAGDSGGPYPLPSQASLNAWKSLAPVFNSDRYIIYELFNEPEPQSTLTSAWTWWQNGSNGQIVSVPVSGRSNVSMVVVGHQQLINAIRATGGHNVIVADGLNYARDFRGMPLLTDPLGQLGLGVHPYFTLSYNTSAEWNADFGFLAANHSVIATEWESWSKNSGCQTSDPVVSAQLLSYLKSLNIGLTAWAFDIPGTVIENSTWTPTNFVNYSCGTSGTGGAGVLVQQAYKSGW